MYSTYVHTDLPHPLLPRQAEPFPAWTRNATMKTTIKLTPTLFLSEHLSNKVGLTSHRKVQRRQSQRIIVTTVLLKVEFLGKSLNPCQLS